MSKVLLPIELSKIIFHHYHLQFGQIEPLVMCRIDLISSLLFVNLWTQFEFYSGALFINII
jgi:hypothetical protein